MALYSGPSSLSPPFSGGRAPRQPSFLRDARSRRAPEDVVFAALGAAPAAGDLDPALAVAQISDADDGQLVDSPMAAATPAAVVPEVPAPGQIEFAERVAAAVGAMRLTTERLAEQVRSDALEVALLVARRIVEAELRTNIEPLFGVIRTVVKRAGESRRITIHLCPDDALRVEAAGGSKSLPGITAAQVDVRADQTMTSGDCIVEADFGFVDGRLDTRLEELRRILSETLAGMAGTTGLDR